MAKRRKEPSGVELEPLLTASRVITAAVVASLAAVDTSVTVPQLRVLVMLDEHESANLGAVASGLGVNPSNASRTCERLVRAGLVHRAENETDRRQLRLTLSPAGRRVLDEVMERRRSMLAAVVRGLRKEDRGHLMKALEAFNAAAAAAPTEAEGGPDVELLRWLP